MSGTFNQNFPALDAHVKDYRQIETNREMIAIAEALYDEPQNIHGFPCVISDAAPSNDVYLIPSPQSLREVFADEPTRDLRRFFGRITNVGM